MKKAVIKKLGTYFQNGIALQIFLLPKVQVLPASHFLLSFQQSTNAGFESLYINCTPKSFPNFTIFTCYFDIFVEKKITAIYLSNIHSLMTQDSNLPTNILNIILSSPLDHSATLNTYLYCKFLHIKSFWFHDQFLIAAMTSYKL